MMNIPRLHPETIEEVKQRAEIVDVISGHVILRKRGKDFVGLCPFHDEKSPSFTVSPSKQMYYCFGCSAGGNAVKFLMELGKRSFSEVVLELAQRYQIPIKTVEPEQRQELQRELSLREHLYEILAIAAKFYEYTLHQLPGKRALDYLVNQRQLQAETIQAFQLGYAPLGWETIYTYLVEQKNYPLSLVEQAGLILPRKSGGSGYYDRFRDRLMIPIRDIQGKVIGFGGRSLGDELPKYLNSPETILFDKGKILFGLDQAKNAISKTDQAIVVEGYFDVISLHAKGINQVVASLGTALSLDQVRLLLRYTESKQIILNFDADQAGTQASERAINEMAQLAYQGQIQLRVLNLPDGKDADEFLKSYSPDFYRQLITKAPLWLDWQIQQLIHDKDLKQADQYSQVSQEMVKLLNKITDDNQLTHYLQYCAEILSHKDSRRVSLLTDNLLNQVVSHWSKLLKEDEFISLPLLIRNKLKPRAFSKTKVKSNSGVTSSENLHPERTLLEQVEGLLLRVYIHSPDHRKLLMESLEARDIQFSFSHHRLLWQQFLILAKTTPLSLQLDPSNFISKLEEQFLEFPEFVKQISPLFHLDELSELHLYRVPLVIRAGIACLEQILSKKRRRIALELWQNTNIKDQPDLAKLYHQQFYSEQEWITELERLRQVNFYDLVDFDN